MTLRQPGIVYDARMRGHVNEANPNHPEQPDRISRIWDLLRERGLVARCCQLEVGSNRGGEGEGGRGGWREGERAGGRGRDRERGG